MERRETIKMAFDEFHPVCGLLRLRLDLLGIIAGDFEQVKLVLLGVNTLNFKHFFLLFSTKLNESLNILGYCINRVMHSELLRFWKF